MKIDTVKKLVNESLTALVKNGYDDFLTQPLSQVVEEMPQYEPLLEGVESTVLEPVVKSWIDARKLRAKFRVN